MMPNVKLSLDGVGFPTDFHEMQQRTPPIIKKLPKPPRKCIMTLQNSYLGGREWEFGPYVSRFPCTFMETRPSSKVVPSLLQFCHDSITCHSMSRKSSHTSCTAFGLKMFAINLNNKKFRKCSQILQYTTLKWEEVSKSGSCLLNSDDKQNLPSPELDFLTLLWSLTQRLHVVLAVVGVILDMFGIVWSEFLILILPSWM